jgi:hypothetical protein
MGLIKNPAPGMDGVIADEKTKRLAWIKELRSDLCKLTCTQFNGNTTLWENFPLLVSCGMNF